MMRHHIVLSCLAAVFLQEPALSVRVDDGSDEGLGAQAAGLPSWSSVASWTTHHLNFFSFGGSPSESSSGQDTSSAPAVAADAAKPTTPPAVADAAAVATKAQDIFDGDWKSSAGDLPSIAGDSITWEGKYRAQVLNKVDHQVSISLDGATVKANLSADGQKLVWGDGDVWNRVVKKEAPKVQPAPSLRQGEETAVRPSAIRSSERLEDVDKAAKLLAEKYTAEASEASDRASKQAVVAAQAQAHAAKVATEVAQWKARAVEEANKVVTLKASAASERHTANAAEEVKLQAERDAAKAMTEKASAVTRALEAEQAVTRAEQDALVAQVEAPKAMAEAERIARGAEVAKSLAEKEQVQATLAEVEAKEADGKAKRAQAVRAAAERAEAAKEAREAEMEAERVHEEKAKAYKDAGDAENREWADKVQAHKTAVARLQANVDALHDAATQIPASSQPSQAATGGSLE